MVSKPQQAALDAPAGFLLRLLHVVALGVALDRYPPRATIGGFSEALDFIGADARTRTGTGLLPRDFNPWRLPFRRVRA
jgi:hypothetical protein